ncbi:hypothetical protein MBLNU230_g2422t1 [Neophaeotheca triangularis]
MPASRNESQYTSSSSPVATSSPSTSTAPVPKRTNTQSSRKETPQSATSSTKPQRLPAPSLFVGPPSHNASNLSISRPDTDRPKTGTSAPATTQNQNSSNPQPQNRPSLPTPTLSASKLNDPNLQTRPDPATGLPDQRALDAAGESLQAERRKQRGEHPDGLRRPSDKSIDTKWREMQNSLNEVELTAQSSTNVFGASHAAALDELRRAQVELARAWGRGNEDRAANVVGGGGGEGTDEKNVGRFAGADEIAGDRVDVANKKSGAGRERTDTQTSAATASTTLSDEEASTASPQSKGKGKDGVSKTALEDETAHDIKLASERRAANDRYFNKVDMAVKDVVTKLEGVAEAMRGVEGESRSLWSGSSGSSGATAETYRRASGNESVKTAGQSESVANTG